MWKKIWKTFLKNSGLARARIISKKKTAVHDNSFANPFSDFPIEREKWNPWNPHLDFLIEIHREDEFLGGEIRFRISRLVAKSEIRISNLNPDFSIERNLWCTLHLLMATASSKTNNVVTSKQQHNNNV